MKLSRLVFCIVAAVGLPAVAQGTKDAAPKRVYSLRELTIAGDMSEAERQRLRERTMTALEMVVGTKGGELVHQEDVERVLAERPKLRACTEWGCAVELGDLLRANRLLVVRIQRKGPSGQPGAWEVKGTNFAVDALRLVGAQEFPCEGCVPEDLVTRNTITRALEALIRTDPLVQLCRLRVETAPSEVRVAVDDTELGTTPLERTVSPGSHTVTVSQKGFNNATASLDCPKGGTERVRFELTPQGATSSVSSGTDGKIIKQGPTMSTPDRRPLYRGLGFASLGLAALSAAGLGVAVYYNGRLNCDRVNCPQTYNATPGIAVAAVGLGAFAVGAAVLLWQGYKPRQPPAARLSVSPELAPGRAALSLVGSF